MEVDLCKAVSSALFGGPQALELVPLDSAADGFQKLAQKEVDLIAGARWNLDNDVKEPTTGKGFAFSQPYFFGPGESNLCLATLQDDADWSTFVFWIMTATIFAEERGVNRTTSNSMPIIDVFGEELQRMARDAILEVGNYGEIYARNLESIIPRSGRNLLNVNGQGPQHYPMPGLM